MSKQFSKIEYYREKKSENHIKFQVHTLIISLVFHTSVHRTKTIFTFCFCMHDIQRKLFTISNNYNNVSLSLKFEIITKQETIVQYVQVHYCVYQYIYLPIIRRLSCYICGKEGDLQLFSVYNYSIFHIHLALDIFLPL